ncbi:unnamed protein product [Adineta steineri]|uniref:Uncharacterized protein n=3 Tax=Adineta steineri TaxID=433720 RepID=A0A815FSX4_9BILA|nr:unnamed protein product [Adineta steineri]CAF1328038.1 unnamed protein product [Adineta steineri]CAF3615486.1 unnamed protein product [Adineta steineri]CAF3955998.1 unnamed protein product [Adineta steineri]
MISSQACSAFHAQRKLSACRWESSCRSITNERGSTFFEEPAKSSSELLTNKKAHPIRHLLCAILSTVLFFVTGIVAVFYAMKALYCERNGYYEQALIHSNRSLSWSMATFVIALFIYLTIGLFIVISKTHHY